MDRRLSRTEEAIATNEQPPSLFPSNRTATETFVRSRFVGRLELENGVALVTHVLGNHRVLCDRENLSILDRFSAPTSANACWDDHAGPKEVRILEALLRSHLLQNHPAADAQSIQRLYAVHFHQPPDEGWTPAIFADNASTAHSTIAESCILGLSKALAVLPLTGGEVLVTHPLGRRLYLTDGMWQLAQQFADAQPVEVVLDCATFPQYSRDELFAACEFLFRHKVLWRSVDEERAAAEAAYSGVKRLAGIHVVEFAGQQWEQKFRPYGIKDVRLPRRSLKVAAVGYCQIHAYTPALLFMAESVGWRLDIRGFYEVSDEFAGEPWDAVLSAATPLAAEFLEALALQDISHARAVLPGVASSIDRHIHRLRSCTAAPILLHSLGHPGLCANQPYASTSREMTTILAELNHQVASSLARHGNGYLLDQDRVVSGHAVGIHWDDEFNGTSHHSCVSLWGRPPRAWVGGPFASNTVDSIPPVQACQRDTVIPCALGHLEFLLSYYEENHVRLILFDPDGLLWPGRLSDRSAPHPAGFNFYTGDHYSLFIGINEALVQLRNRGVQLACISPLSYRELAEKWLVRERVTTLVRFSDCSVCVESPATLARLRGVLSELNVDERHTLWLSRSERPPTGYMGRVYSGSQWAIRRYLLTAPELSGIRDERAQEQTTARRAAGFGSHANQTVAGGDEQSVRQLFDATACEFLRCSKPELTAVDDLRLLGADSLAAAALVTLLEKRLGGVALHESKCVHETLFSKSALLEAIIDALRQNDARVEVIQKAGRDLLSKDEWCAQDLRQILVRHARNPSASWIIKCVKSPNQGDHEYVTWAQLLNRARGYAAMYQRTCGTRGAVIAILLPQSVDLVAAIVGAILARCVPAVHAFPSDKLSTRTFAEWFARVIKTSNTSLVICDDSLRTDVGELLARDQINLPLISEAPAPIVCAAADDEPNQPDHPAILQYSSGTTGLKKAVMLSSRSILSQIWMLKHELPLRTGDVIASWLPLYHDMGLIASLLLPLLCSVPVVLMSPFDWVKRPEMLLREMSAERATWCWMPNFAFLHMARRVGPRPMKDVDLSCVRGFINCSEPITALAMHSFYRAFSALGLMYSALGASYAMAEATFAVTQTRPGGLRLIHVDDEEFRHTGNASVVARVRPVRGSRAFVSSGRPMQETRVRIVDECGNEVPDGHVGEIIIQSPSSTTEYYADPESTAAVFRAGWYYTGDLGFLLDGELYVTGRKKDMIIVAGSNLYPHDLEDVVASVPGVRPGRVVTFGIYDESLGTERLVILLETDENCLAPEECLKAQVRQAVLGRCSVPVYDVRILPPQRLVKSTSGKLSRRRNREMYLSLYPCRPMAAASTDAS
jgi:fatty-acyl-CoA synthase